MRWFFIHIHVEVNRKSVIEIFFHIYMKLLCHDTNSLQMKMVLYVWTGGGTKTFLTSNQVILKNLSG